MKQRKSRFRTPKSSKKAQMEMMGLAIIVILLALGMFLLVKFMVIDKPPSVKQTFTSKELATNMISTMLKTDADCGVRNLDMTELIIAYSEHDTFTCKGMELREYLQESLDDIFNQTLITWGRQYRFEIKVPQESDDITDICMPENSAGDCFSCPGGLEKKIFPLPSNYGTVIITMDICT